MKWALPLIVACISAPPTSAIVVARPVTALITCGPVRNMCALFASHDHEVHQRRRVRRAARTGTTDHRDLRHDAGEQDVGVEDVAVAGECIDTFLNARAA
jgi:hypothetical protein